MKIGITIDLSLAFWANGVQQNIVFLNHLFSSVPENQCYYISESRLSDSIENETEYISPEQIKKSNMKFDVIIVAGLGLDNEIYDYLKKVNPNIKIVLIHCFNKLMDDIAFTIGYSETGKSPMQTPKYLSEIWVLPHHEFSVEYIKSYYNFDNIKRAPYLWNAFFVNQKLNEMAEKGVSPLFKKGGANKVCIFEPNFSHIKNCIIPLMICEKFENTFGSELFSLNVFCCEKLRKNNFFKKFVSRLSILNKRRNFCFFNNKWSTLAGLARWGSSIVSHQMYNYLNYAHLEALYLGLPLIHNSETLMNLGYYYPDFDIDMGAKQLKSAIINHDSCITEYTADARSFIGQFDPKLDNNVRQYMDLLKL